MCGALPPTLDGILVTMYHGIVVFRLEPGSWGRVPGGMGAWWHDSWWHAGSWFLVAGAGVLGAGFLVLGGMVA